MIMIIDSDALIKLTKCGAKEALVSTFEALIPPAVREEAIEQGLAQGYTDAGVLKANLEKGSLKLATVADWPLEASILPEGGEREVYALYQSFPASIKAVVVTGDRKVIDRLRTLNVPVLVPSIVLVALYRTGRYEKETVTGWLERLKPLVSEAEYALASHAIAGHAIAGHAPAGQAPAGEIPERGEV